MEELAEMGDARARRVGGGNIFENIFSPRFLPDL